MTNDVSVNKLIGLFVYHRGKGRIPGSQSSMNPPHTPTQAHAPSSSTSDTTSSSSSAMEVDREPEKEKDKEEDKGSEKEKDGDSKKEKETTTSSAGYEIFRNKINVFYVFTEDTMTIHTDTPYHTHPNIYTNTFTHPLTPSFLIPSPPPPPSPPHVYLKPSV